MRYTDLFENDDEDMFGPSDADLFGGRSTYKTVQKLLRDPANVIEMRFMKGQYAVNQCIGAQDLDGHPYLFGKSLKNPNSKARLSWPWSKNSDLSTRVVHLGPNHYAIVLKSTTLRRGNKYQGMPFVAEEEQSDDDLFGARKMYYVNIMGNWNTGRYSDYGARRYIVPGSSPEGAIAYLKNNEDLVYAYIDGQKFTNGKRVVRKPARQHVFLDNSTVFGTAPDGSDSAIERFIRKHRAL
jgi:hypothetical protein